MLATIGAAALAGCVSESDGEPDAHDAETESAADSYEHELGYGDWHESDRHGLNVVGVESTTSVVVTHADKNDEHEIPGDQKLVFADFELKALSPDTSSAPSYREFDLVADGRAYDFVEGIDGIETCSAGECDERLNIDWIQRADESDRLTPSESLEHGETAEYWLGALVPDSVSVAEVGVAFQSTARWSG